MTEIDAHCHFWSLARGDYGWLEGEGGPLAPIRRDFSPDDMPGTAPVIAVQAAPTTAETDFLLSLNHPRLAGVVGWVDLSSDCVSGHIADRADNPRFRGIRPMLQDIPQTDWLLTAPRADALATLSRMNLTFDALVTPRHLDVLAQFAAANPDLAIVIDHAAKPRLALGQTDEEWRAGMARLADDPRIHCKLSGLLTELSPQQLADPLAVLRPVVAQLLDWFGPSRLIWGSDWPVLNLASDYDHWRSLTQALLADLSQDERDDIMSGSAARFYGVAI
ncbi:amidohydrolase family protein [Paracoccus sp. (in: a-proteobacteria)]|uniref:amidohydrolase family protein n=1 Tax=Paracoccus sp. TaxID=267 RepID=UPI00289704FD|nr:amidohydrolase family protein [Paracoccus sp. (in: a-proteobacteria)]